MDEAIDAGYSKVVGLSMRKTSEPNNLMTIQSRVMVS
jgi:hypothetical protein